MPSRLARSSSSFSSASAAGSGLGEPSSRKSAFLERSAACSKVPPIPTPAIRGGQASGPAVLMHSSTHAFTPSIPSAGVSILYFERFSQPPPLAMIWMRRVLPGDELGVDHAGGVVAGVHAVEGRPHDGGAEIALGVAGADARVDGVGEEAALHVDVLADLDEADHEAGVLAVRDLPASARARRCPSGSGAPACPAGERSVASARSNARSTSGSRS